MAWKYYYWSNAKTFCGKTKFSLLTLPLQTTTSVLYRDQWSKSRIICTSSPSTSYTSFIINIKLYIQWICCVSGHIIKEFFLKKKPFPWKNVIKKHPDQTLVKRVHFYFCRFSDYNHNNQFINRYFTKNLIVIKFWSLKWFLIFGRDFQFMILS